MSKEESSGEAKPQDASASDVQADVSPKDTNAEIYENRGTKKIIRVVTVMAYLFSVSFVGILLSAYYIFLWEPPNPRLIERGRLQADPQMQFLMATMPSEKTDMKKKGNDFFLQTEVNRAYKPLLGRMTYGAYDGNDSNVNSQDRKQERLNAMLLRLRHSLVETHAQNRNLSKHVAAISGGSDNSSIRVEKMLNSTKITENSISNELQDNITEEKTRNNNIDLPPKFTDTVNMLDIESTRTSKNATLLGRMTYGAYDGDDSNVNSQDRKQERLNAMLLRLRHSLVETHAQNRNLSKHVAAISGGSDNSSIRVEKMLNSTKITENSISNELQDNITEEKTRNNNIDRPPKFTDTVNMLDIESTRTSKNATIRENKMKQKHFNGRSIIDSNLIVDHENQKFSKIDILNDIKELIKQNETDDRQLINDNRKSDPNNVRTITRSKEYAEDVTKRLLSTNVSVNNLNSRRNYSSNNEYPSSNHIEEITRNEVSTISSSHDSGYIHNNPEFHQSSDDLTIVTRNSEGERIRVDSPAFLMAPG